MNYYVEPWRWVSPGPHEGGHWTAPPGAVAAIDLRPISARGTREQPLGVGLFASEEAVASILTDHFDEQMTSAASAKLIAALGFPLRPFSAMTLSGIVWELLTQQSHPDGVTSLRPLMPDVGGVLRLHFGGAEIRSSRLTPDAEEWPSIQRMYHAQYRALAAEPGDRHQRMLTVWMEHLHVQDHRLFIPSGLPIVDPLPHHTTITDNFNRANQAGLGTSAGGWSWTGTNYSIDGNTARGEVNDGGIRAESDLSSSDHYTQSTFADNTVGIGYGGVAARYASAAETFYTGFGSFSSADNRIATFIANVRNDIFTASGHALVVGDVMRLTVNGSSLTFTINGVTEIGPSTDTAIAGNTRTGLCSISIAGKTGLDDFSAADLAATTKTFLLH